MMRRLMLILGSLVVATVGFLTYMVWQSPDSTGPSHVDTHLTPTTLKNSETVNTVGPGDGVWMKQYDKDGNLTSILRANRYVPRQGGSVVDVIEPEAEFFLSGGRRLILNGDRGVVNVEQRPSANRSGGMSGGAEAAPTSGFLYNVVIRIFEPQTPDRPSLTLNTNNISFDTQTFKFATESFTDSYGQVIPADGVPVTIRGNDVDFDGKGLIARYDDLNQRIAMLQITHGDQMTIKRSELLPSGLTKTASDKPAATPNAVKPAPSSVTPGETSVAAAAPAGNSKEIITVPAPTAPAETKSQAPATTTATTRSKAVNGPTIYRATFLDEVRITQGEAPMAEADVLAIEFFPLQSGKTGPTTKPDTRPVAPATRPVKEPATTKSAATAPATTSPATHPATNPTTAVASTQPAPVIVKWKGTLRLVAIDTPAVPLAPGESSVNAVGTPLVLHQPKNESASASAGVPLIVRCGSALFHSRDNAVHLRSSEQVPTITFTDLNGQSTLTTGQMDYSDATRTAVLTGPSTLHLLQPKQGNQPATELTAKWKDRCVATMFGSPRNAVKQIDLSGDVDVNHPMLKMKSSALSMAFKPDTADAQKSVLDQITATGAVACDLSDAKNPNRTLHGEKVIVGIAPVPGGQMFPKTVDAEGSVHATNDDQSLTADTMQVTLARKPTTKPVMPAAGNESAVAEQTALQTFHAAGSVVMLTKDGKSLADEVNVDQTSGHPVIELRGKPASLATQGSTLTGALIIARPDDNVAKVEGPGTIHATESGGAAKPAPGAAAKPATTRPVDLAWAGGADLDGNRNLITVRDEIVINTTEADGTKIRATSNSMVVTLKSAPTTQPAKAVATSQPAMDALKNKLVSAVTLIGNVNVTSTLNSPTGELLKRSLVQTEKLTANMDDSPQLSTQQLASIDIPGPGQALIEDLTGKKPQPGKQNAGGATAVGWKKSFHLDQGANPVATLTGDVHVHHDDAGGPGPNTVDLQSSKVIITFTPEPKGPTSKPASKPTTRPAEMAAGIKQIYAAAPVQFKARTYSFTAQALQYTPENHLVLISGTDRQPVDYFDSEKGTRGQFQQVWYNVEAQFIEKSTGVTVQGGK